MQSCFFECRIEEMRGWNQDGAVVEEQSLTNCTLWYVYYEISAHVVVLKKNLMIDSRTPRALLQYNSICS